jgi:hypothetical protein
MLILHFTEAIWARYFTAAPHYARHPSCDTAIEGSAQGAGIFLSLPGQQGGLVGILDQKYFSPHCI